MNVRNALPLVQTRASEAQLSSVEKTPNTPKPSLVPAAGDHADLSNAASLASHAASLPDVRAEKVQSVQAAIADGSYHVSADDVAQSLVNHMLGKE